MNRSQTAILIYAPLIIISIPVSVATEWGGVWGCAVSLLGIIFSRTIIFLFLSFVNVSLSIAFDNFIRVDPYFYFYDQNGVDASFLCLISTLLYCGIGILDRVRPSSAQNYLIEFREPHIHRHFFWPLALLIGASATFVLSNESFVLTATYDAKELQKYPFLEYMGLLIAFLLLSTRKLGNGYKIASFAISGLFSLVCLATSYRMVAIICLLSIFMISFNQRNVRKITLVAAWLIAYVGLTYISYWRIGHFDVDLPNILGYVDGRMDNTFTGVIETSLQYTSIGKDQGLAKNFIFLIGATLPLPNSLIPDSMLYIVDALENHRFPGGGTLAGFIIYFNYIYLLPYAAYLAFSFTRSLKSDLAAGMYIILFITIMRWWLYGPYVIFKFLGVLVVLLITNRLLIYGLHSIRKI